MKSEIETPKAPALTATAPPIVPGIPERKSKSRNTVFHAKFQKRYIC